MACVNVVSVARMGGSDTGKGSVNLVSPILCITTVVDWGNASVKGKSMRTYVMLLSAVALLSTLFSAWEADAQEHQLGHQQALAEIRQRGGEIIVGSTQPNSPVAVVLTGSPSPADCLPFLKDVSNLHTCDL